MPPKQRFTNVPQRNKMMSAEPPSLVDLCVQTAIDNVQYLGDVGETDLHLLERILPHCTVDQLMYVENETKERDLSQVTNKLWKRYYEKKFGDENTNKAIENLRKSKRKYTWKELYEVKLEIQDQAQKESLERLRERYKKEDERRQSRQIQFCSKAPPAKKRFFTGGSGGSSGGYGSWNSSVSNVKSNIMKKSKIEYLNSQETKIRAAIKRNPIQRSPVVSSTSKPGISPYKPALSQGNLGSSQFRNSSSIPRDLKSQGTTQSKQGNLQFQGSASASSSASASRHMQTDRTDGIRRNPGTLKGKATSLPPRNSVVAPRTNKVDWDDDIKKKLSEFW